MQLSKEIIKLLEDEDFLYDKHFLKRRMQRNLVDINVVQAIVNGEVIESLKRYNNGEKYIVHCVQDKKIFHIILQYNNGTLLLKTIYKPNEEKCCFKDDLKTRIDGDLLSL